MAPVNGAGIQIGETLRAARKRLGLDVASLEKRTHIRTRYLRALEDENWDDLPSETYARAFLRTYADELGLDAEALCEELRLRQGGRVGGAEALVTPLTDEQQPSRWLVGALAAAIALLLLILAFAGGDGGEGESGPGVGPGSSKSKSKSRKKKEKRGGGNPDRPAKAGLTLVPLTGSRVCVASGGRALVDRQILATGNRERFDEARRFIVDLEFGEIRLRTLREQTRLRADTAGEPLSVIVKPGQIRRVPYTGDSCP
jgi:hypothetical protein